MVETFKEISVTDITAKSLKGGDDLLFYLNETLTQENNFEIPWRLPQRADSEQNLKSYCV